jgi:hypothetical protein
MFDALPRTNSRVACLIGKEVEMNVLSPAIVASILTGSAAELQKQPAFVAAAFVRLQPGTPELEKRFSWPGTNGFQTTHQLVAGATPIRLIGGQITVEEGRTTHQRQVIVALDQTPGGGAVRIDAENETGEYETATELWRVPSALWSSAVEKPFSHTSDGITVRFTPSVVAPAPGV